tara:strand:- start:6869 stop:7165 length:297 start_codon:yes stop_codon:yes gene_type:complete
MDHSGNMWGWVARVNIPRSVIFTIDKSLEEAIKNYMSLYDCVLQRVMVWNELSDHSTMEITYEFYGSFDESSIFNFVSMLSDGSSRIEVEIKTEYDYW